MSSTLVHEDEETKSLPSHGPLGIGVYQENFTILLCKCTRPISMILLQYFAVSAVEKSTDNHRQTLEMLLGEWNITHSDPVQCDSYYCVCIYRHGGGTTTPEMRRLWFRVTTEAGWPGKSTGEWSTSFKQPGQLESYGSTSTDGRLEKR